MSVDTTRFCGTCGAPRTSPVLRFCQQCGASFLGATVGVASPPLSGARRRPRSLVTLLGLFGSATYSFFWLWMSWRELKRIRGDASMSPFWHSVAIFMFPVYGLFRFHAHFRTIDDLLAAAGVPVRAGAGLLTLVFLLLLTVLYGSSAVGLASAASGSAIGLTPLSLVVVAAGYQYIVSTGQQALNAYYRSLPGVDVPERGHAFEYIFIVIFGLSFAAQVYLAASGPRP